MVILGLKIATRGKPVFNLRSVKTNKKNKKKKKKKQPKQNKTPNQQAFVYNVDIFLTAIDVGQLRIRAFLPEVSTEIEHAHSWAEINYPLLSAETGSLRALLHIEWKKYFMRIQKKMST